MEIFSNGRHLRWDFIHGTPMAKAQLFDTTWRDYFEGKDVPLAELLATIPIAASLDHHGLEKKVTVLVERSWTVENVLALVPVLGVISGLEVQIVLRPFGVLKQEVLDPGSPVYTASPDAVLLLWQLDDFLPDIHECWGWTEDVAAERVGRAVGAVEALLRTMSARYAGPVVCFDFGLDPLMPAKSVLDYSCPRSPDNVRQSINEGVKKCILRLTGSNVRLLSLAGLQYRVGFRRWQDERSRLTSGCPVSAHALTAIFDEVVQLIAADVSKPRKVLVLDGDNTLWGGILAEDGIDGIRLGGDYPGNVFVEIQKLVLQFFNQGIVLALCSKNDDKDVRALFAGQRGMLLKLDHFAAWEVNWKPKSENIRDIASRLNIGLDSFVFVDDSPQEREEVRLRCPEVLVPDVPDNPMQLYRFWIGFNPFARAKLSAEDTLRARSYTEEAKRGQIRNSSVSIEDFYRDLEMRVRVRVAGEKDLVRIAQMSQRTNQFNATTVRMSEADVRRIMLSPLHRIHLLSLSDRCGDSGVVACAVLRIEGRTINVEQFMLSCRALKRTVEHHFLGLIAKEYEGVVSEMCISYVPSDRNGMVLEFMNLLGSCDRTEAGQILGLQLNQETVSRLLKPWITSQ
jgi:FkbH-like protein